MPWKEICTVELREALVAAMLAGEVGVADLCRRAGVSRKTVYKWRERYQALGRAGLADRSRARLTQPDAVSDDVLDAILSTRLEHPTWGVKKILPYLSRMDPGLELPCLSTASEILRRAGLTSPRKKARRRPGPHNKSQEADTPNATWTIDFTARLSRRFSSSSSLSRLISASPMPRNCERQRASVATLISSFWQICATGCPVASICSTSRSLRMISSGECLFRFMSRAFLGHSCPAGSHSRWLGFFRAGHVTYLPDPTGFARVPKFRAVGATISLRSFVLLTFTTPSLSIT